MALIKCPECKNQVSDKAVTCPHCGFPIAQTLAQDNESENNEMENPDYRNRSRRCILVKG